MKRQAKPQKKATKKKGKSGTKRTVNPPTTERPAPSQKPTPVVPQFPEVSDPRKNAFLGAFCLSGGNVTRAAHAAGVDVRTVWNWRHQENDEKFLEMYAIACQVAKDAIEGRVLELAMEGHLEPVYYKGQVCGVIRKVHDVLSIFAAKGAMPEKYRERHEFSGPNGGPIPVQNVQIYLPHNGREQTT